MPEFHFRLPKEGIEAPGEFGEIMARNLRIQVVFQMIGQFEKKRRYQFAAQRVRLSEGSFSIVFVRKIDVSSGNDQLPTMTSPA